MADQSDKGNYSMSISNSSNNRSSSSSISISCSSSSDTVDDCPSSSGCSFDMLQRKTKRKDKVKGFLKELKTMVNLEKPKGSRAGTLSTLEHVVNSMRKIKAQQMESDKDSRSQQSRDDLESGFQSFTTASEEGTAQNTDEDVLVLVLSPWTGMVENISQNVKHLLGYPAEMMLGQPLAEFIGVQDHSTLTKLLSFDVSEIDKLENAPVDPMSAEDAKKMYFSLRTYKGLDKGFNMGACNRFIPFEVKVLVKSLREGESPDTVSMGPGPTPTPIQPGLISHGKRTCIVLRCNVLETSYRGPQCTPENRTFTTKHNTQFVYSTLHRNAITLLGYLPQEFIGSSVFDHYHPDDLPELYHIYHTVVCNEEKPYKSKPFRLRVKNGDFIVVETEWSAMINKWSREIEFVVGQHTIIRGPNNPNVFECSPSQAKVETNSTNKFILQEKIRKLLTKGSESSSGENLFSVPKARGKKKEKPEKSIPFAVEKIPETAKDFQERRAQSPSVSDPLSPPQDVYDVNPSMTYEHLNYKTNIRRFLLSQPKTYSSVESAEKKSLSCLEEDDVSDEYIQATLVDFAIPKPPSFGSSTKVLVSEQEPREEIKEDIIIASPVREEPMEDEIAAPKDQAEAYLPVTLTQETLRAHTKMQEKLYVQQATQEMQFSPTCTFGQTIGKGSNRLKRVHSPERDVLSDHLYRMAKSYRTDNMEKRSKDVLKPFFPLTPMEKLSSPKDQVQPFSCWTSYDPTTTHPSNFPTNLTSAYSQGIPLVQMSVAPNGSYSIPTTSSHSSIQWPYYSANAAAAYPFLPLYTPMTLLKSYSNAVYTQASTTGRSKRSQHLNRIAETLSSSSLSSQANNERKKPLCARKANPGQGNQANGLVWSESSDSLEDTTSSLLYLLESDSHNNSSCLEEMELIAPKFQHHLPKMPPWLQRTKWTKETELQYVLPKRSTLRILKEDRERLSAMTHSDQPYHQLQELLEELNKVNCHPTIDEEADALIFPHQDMDTITQADDGFSLISLDDPNACGCDHDHDHGLKSITRCKKGKLKAKQESCQDSKESGDSDTTLLMKDDKKQQDSPGSASGNEAVSSGKLSDTADVDSTSSKESSNLTPSDQRSNEEAPSSLKESDTMSKEESDTSCRDQKDTESDKESRSIPQIDFSEKILTPLKIRVPKICQFSKMKKLSSWMTETTFNENIEKKYQLKIKSKEEVLEEDWKRSLEMAQSDVVKAQFYACQEEIKEKQFAKTRTEQLRNVIITELMGSMMTPQETTPDAAQSEVVLTQGPEASAGRNSSENVTQEGDNSCPENDSMEGECSREATCSSQQIVEKEHSHSGTESGKTENVGEDMLCEEQVSDVLSESLTLGGQAGDDESRFSFEGLFSSVGDHGMEMDTLGDE
ncbi:period circadian protein-like isoform X2 [Liolophura sinensis]|uniref:period circadian protein-like isoform X2 n=1 Tax=Liolophura sinensis TaxID=3198878 RepID=UPI0031585578